MATADILRRKLRPHVSALTRPPAEATVERSMQLALGRAAQQDCALPVIVTQVAALTLSLPELLEQIEPGTLLAVLEGEGEALGLVALDASALAAILEQQTTGTVTATAPVPRLPTRIDAAMCAPLIDLLLEEFDIGLHDCARAGKGDLPPQGFRYASFIEDPRPLGLVLEDGRYRSFSVAVALGTVARPGRVLVALPVTEGGARAAADAVAPPAGAWPQSLATGSGPGAWQARLNRAVCPAAASLHAVLVRLRLPLARVTAWQPGDVIALPGARLDDVAMGATPPGAALLRGRLGQCRGQRAVRLSPPLLAALAADTPSVPDSPAPAG